MTTRGNVGGVFLTVAMTAALWAWSGGVAGAQVCDGPCPPPVCPPCVNDVCPPCVECGAPPVVEGSPGSVTCSGSYYPGREVNVFTFGPDNSIQVKFAQVTCSEGFSVQVTLFPTTQTAFHDRLKSTTCTTPPSPLFDDGLPPPEVTCNETVVLDVGAADDPTSFCAVYRVTPSRNDCYSGPVFDERVSYFVGWKAPAKGNKHDFFLLRDPDSADPNYNSAAPLCFSQNITDGTVDRNYIVGTIRDPGLGGRTCCPSDYVVARQKIRPITKQD